MQGRRGLERGASGGAPVRAGAPSARTTALALAAVACLSIGCAAERRIQPQAADVRLDIVARALTHVEERSRAARSRGNGTEEERRALASALSDALESLFLAERAVEAWEHGDPRAWARARPCLGESLQRVDVALVALEIPPPPGLTEVVRPSPLRPCVEPASR